MNFKKITIILFSIIAILLSLTLALFLYLVAEVENDGSIINIAGRQRMLSQKITKLSMQIAYQPKSISNQNKGCRPQTVDMKADGGLFTKSSPYPPHSCWIS